MIEKVALERFYAGTVGPEEIDNLGHMNVSYYLSRAVDASRALAASLGLDAARLAEMKAGIFAPDVVSRFYREQMEGASICVEGGVIGAQGDTLSVYQQLGNTDSGDLAATFVLRVQLFDLATRQPLAWPEDIVDGAKARTIDLPPQGQTRMLSMEPPKPQTIESLEAVGLGPGDKAVVAADVCDASGFMHFGFREGFHITQTPHFFEITGAPIATLSDGAKIGWPTIEDRHVWYETPRAGDEVIAYSTIVQMEGKAHHWRYWSFNAKTRRLLMVKDMGLLAFDLDTRKAIDVPAESQTRLDACFHPQLF